MPDRHDPPPSQEQPAPTNRAARRATGRHRPLPSHGDGKVHPQRFDHAPDPRSYVGQQRG